MTIFVYYFIHLWRVKLPIRYFWLVKLPISSIQHQKPEQAIGILDFCLYLYILKLNWKDKLNTLRNITSKLNLLPEKSQKSKKQTYFRCFI